MARERSRTNPGLREAYGRSLPDWRDEDVCGSPFAVQRYEVNVDFGGNEALASLRERMARRNLKLLLDFVPNHVAPDHPWVDQHPEFFIEGTEDDLRREPRNWGRFSTSRGSRVLAYGRDPFFPGWPDTVQLNYQHAGLREAMLGELGRVAGRCDGVRCDMAMLVQPEVFRANLGRSRQATRRLARRRRSRSGTTPSPAIRRRHPDFVFVAEVYWDMEWDLQQAGLRLHL